MRFFYDCEFIEDGRTIDLLSLGMVTETGEELYVVSTECDISRANPGYSAMCYLNYLTPATMRGAIGGVCVIVLRLSGSNTMTVTRWNCGHGLLPMTMWHSANFGVIWQLYRMGYLDLLMR